MDKDDYVLKVYIRHEKKEILDKLLDLPMTITYKLPTPISVEIYSSHANASVCGKKCSSLNIPRGSSIPIYLTAPNINEKYTKHPVLGQFFQGTMTLANEELGKKADHYVIKCVLNEIAKKDKNKNGNNGKKCETPPPNFAESMAEQKINWISKIDPGSDEALKLFEALKIDESASQAQLRLARISGKR